MKKTKKFLSVFLALIMIISIIPMSSITASAYYSVSRDDGVWLFPLSSGYYSQFSDWAGCPGNGNCPFCGYVHSSWTDGDHTGQPAGHNGIDVSAPTGTSVYAPATGSVIGASYQDARGYIVMVKHDIGNGWAYYSYSQHLNSISVSVGQSVTAGTVIGTVGSSGGNYGAHLHFGIIMAPSNYNFAQVLNVDYNSGSTWLKSSGYSTGRILTNPKNGYGYAGVYNAGAAVDYHRGSVTYTFDKSKVSIGSTIATTGITLNATPFTLTVGESKTISATVSPSNATNKTVTWSSSNTSIATVSSSGVVKAIGTGACTITAKASGGQTATVTVVVRNDKLSPVAYATYNGHYYELYENVLSWKDAKEYCESIGGHLVTITSQAENDFVQTLTANGSQTNYYIGGTDEKTEGTWKWVTGETFSYINLGDGEPSSVYYEDEDYLFIGKSNGKWGDVVNITKGVNWYGFICEYETPIEPDAVTVIDGKVYELYDREYPITLAENFANNNNGDLLTINSEEEQNAVASWIQANSTTKYVALGAYADSDRVWHWSNGDAWSYDNWRNGEPNNTNNLENGAMIVLDGYGWNDVSRANAYVFVVEYSLEEWEKDNNVPDTPNTPDDSDANCSFSIQEPSRTEIRNKDGIILHANTEGNVPEGSYVIWTSNNSNFDEDADGNDLTVVAENKGYTTFAATLYDADGNVLATDSVELYSKSGFFDKIGGFFRSLFGSTKIYEY